MPAALSPPTLAVVGVGTPARVTIGTCRDSRSSWSGSSTWSCRISPSLLRASAKMPPCVVVVVHVHRADQQVEVAVLGRHLDAPVDQVGELEALVLVGEEVARRARSRGAADDHADDLLEPRAQRPRRPVRDEAELGDGLQHPFPGLRAGVAAAVEHPRDRRDGHARRPWRRRRWWAARAPPRRCPPAAPCWVPGRLVSAYRRRPEVWKALTNRIDSERMPESRPSQDPPGTSLPERDLKSARSLPACRGAGPGWRLRGRRRAGRRGARAWTAVGVRAWEPQRAGWGTAACGPGEPQCGVTAAGIRELGTGRNMPVTRHDQDRDTLSAV